ncbi:cyclopropane-fatty-acyl-phospholipid synthase family protein [Amphritea sp. 1_MG-2023]|uniref:SAM-dependent methyltransferase n=1 Tax=Amphritea sp. 1_MG-2023 TaxID=3062670 RepID=UPI0026E3990C|nr:cyclopropane-fatty-acyl-phospholipid synthase family protein [Amphritea sp. 1_MG-2023]MDO6563340.1 cyclopropane-fatty-acyl-phospholipid synthase family protein [Amphritea sp. 1_MG-2023]
MKTCHYKTATTADSQVKSGTQQHYPLSSGVNQPRWLEQRVLNRLQKALQHTRGRLHLIMPSGYQQTFGEVLEAHQHNASSEAIHVSVKLNSLRCLLRLLTGGITGWSEGYIAGEWDSPDITALIRWALQNEAILDDLSKASVIKQLLDNVYHWRNHNSPRGSRRNIAAHYDLGNDFYELWLDKSMSYSAALFTNETQTEAHAKPLSLEQAQAAKYQQILQWIQPADDDHILEIGCGWGGFATELLTNHNARLHGITLSQQQRHWAQQQLSAKHLDERADISLTDYRDLLHQYDAVVSIEMFEAVGEQYWDTYFTTLKNCLKPGGTAVLQVISIDEQRFDTYRKQADFIQRYIFPGGMLPSIPRLEQKFAEHGFSLQHKQLFGKDYAETLRLWRHNFTQQTDALEKLGYGEQFRRLWLYYLCYCEGGFEEGSIDVGLYHLVNENPSR